MDLWQIWWWRLFTPATVISLGWIDCEIVLEMRKYSNFKAGAMAFAISVLSVFVITTAIFLFSATFRTQEDKQNLPMRDGEQ